MNSLNRLAENWPLTERRSRVPHAELWRELFRYSGKDDAESLFRDALPDSNPVSQFRNALILADDMVTGWEDTDNFTGSTLLYYGAYWLGQAVVLATLDYATLGSREAQHGLSATFDMTRPLPFLNAKVDFGKRPATLGIINQSFGGDDLAGSSCRVSDLLTALPEMRFAIEHVSLSTQAIRVSKLTPIGLPINAKLPTVAMTLHVDRQLDEPWLRDHIAIYSYLETRRLTIHRPPNEGMIRWRREAAAGALRDDAAERRALFIETGDELFLLPKVKQKAISEYAAYLAVLYVISMLARYNPDYWITLQRDRPREYFLVEEFLNAAEDKIPNLVLNHLSRRTYVFRST